jgi:succinate dehydrogenase/fumarate reductase-like Fe-S protein
MNTAILRVRRGGAGDPPRYDEFAVPFEDGGTVLDALIWVRGHRDPTVAIRYSCINANVCKECTIAINGRVAYACTTKLRAGAAMILDPLPGKLHLRDLVADIRPPRERLAGGGDDPMG